MNLRKRTVALLATMFALALAAAGARAQGNIMDIAERTPTLSRFVQMVEMTGMEETLEGTGPYTIFAPTDAAFDKLGKERVDELLEAQNKARLTALLKNHVVPARITSAEVTVMGDKGVLRTLGGTWLPVRSDNGVLVGKARVEKPDIIGANGVIYLIDSVLLPEVTAAQPAPAAPAASPAPAVTPPAPVVVAPPPKPDAVLVLIPVEKVRSSPKDYIGKSVTGTATVSEVPTDRGFWVEVNGQRMFALLDKSIEEKAVNVNSGQKVRLSGTVYDASRWDQAGLGNITPQARKILQSEPAFLVVKEITVLSS